jgi:hypothetical protein
VEPDAAAVLRNDELIIRENFPVGLCAADVKALLLGSHAVNPVFLDEVEIRIWILKQASE